MIDWLRASRVVLCALVPSGERSARFECRSNVVRGKPDPFSSRAERRSERSDPTRWGRSHRAVFSFWLHANRLRRWTRRVTALRNTNTDADTRTASAPTGCQRTQRKTGALKNTESRTGSGEDGGLDCERKQTAGPAGVSRARPLGSLGLRARPSQSSSMTTELSGRKRIRSDPFERTSGSDDSMDSLRLRLRLQLNRVSAGRPCGPRSRPVRPRVARRSVHLSWRPESGAATPRTTIRGSIRAMPRRAHKARAHIHTWPCPGPSARILSGPARVHIARALGGVDWARAR